MSFHVTTNTDPFDLPWLCEMLKGSYWGHGLTDEKIAKALEHSVNFWIHEYEGPDITPVGFARVVSDHAIFSSLMDVIIDPKYRRRGHGKKLMQAVIEHAAVRETICVISTRDACRFYNKFGFQTFHGILMQRNPS